MVTTGREGSTGGWDYVRALQELWRRSSYERGLISDPFGDPARAERGLDRVRALLTALGNPHLAVPSVHVAGSKGKGSTASFIAAAATSAGHRVGLYTSPHPHRFPERIAIDGAPVADDLFAALAEEATRAASNLEAADPELGDVTTFELVTAMGFVAFARQGCDLAVIEVGLGGRYDSTNVLDPLASVITRIDLEHTAVLGSTHREIAYQKAGILHPGVPCVSSPQIPEAAAEIARVAAEIGTPLLLGGRDWRWSGNWRSFAAEGPWGRWSNLSLGLPGPHQVENACTALAALFIVNETGLSIAQDAVRRGFADVRWPARFERAEADGRTIVFDAAHTPIAAAAVVETWRQEVDSPVATVILGMGSDKDVPSFLRALRPIVGRLIVTRAESPRSAEPDAIAAAARELQLDVERQPTVAAAVVAALGGGLPVLVTGSLFVAGEAREALGLAAADTLWKTAAPGAAASPRR